MTFHTFVEFENGASWDVRAEISSSEPIPGYDVHIDWIKCNRSIIYSTELADFVDSHNMVELPEEVSAQIKLNAVHWALTMIEHKLVCMNQTIKAFDIKAKVNLILDEFK